MKAIAAKPETAEFSFRDWIDGFSLLDRDIPLHHQIYLQIRSEILDGLWVGAEGFPGEDELARKFGVSVITTRRALGRLAHEGWIARARGHRTQIMRGPESTSRRRQAPVMFPVGSASLYSYKVLFTGTDIGPAEACNALALPPGSRLWLCSRLRNFKRRLHSVTLNAQLPHVGERHSRDKLTRLPMSEILRQAGFRTAGLRRRVSASFPPPFVAHHLRIGSQEPTLLHSFTLLDVDGGVIEWVRIFLHPDEISPEEILNRETGEWALTGVL